MPQFTPADREAVREGCEDAPHIQSVGDCGPGLAVTLDKTEQDGTDWTGLMEGYGWYISNIIRDPNGDYMILMPVTEVPSE